MRVKCRTTSCITPEWLLQRWLCSLRDKLIAWWGDRQLPWAVSIPTLSCWECQGGKPLTACYSGRFLGFCSRWAPLRQMVTSPPRQCAGLLTIYYDSCGFPKLAVPHLQCKCTWASLCWQFLPFFLCCGTWKAMGAKPHVKLTLLAVHDEVLHLWPKSLWLLPACVKMCTCNRVTSQTLHSS